MGTSSKEEGGKPKTGKKQAGGAISYHWGEDKEGRKKKYGGIFSRNTARTKTKIKQDRFLKRERSQNEGYPKKGWLRKKGG